MRKFVLYFYVVLDKLLRLLWNSTANDKNIRGHVLMYHHITDEKVNTDPTCVCGISRFKDIINQKISEGYQFTSIENIPMIFNDKSGTKYIVLTFDDIPVTVFTNAFSFLKEKQIPFTVFVATGLINKEGYISSEQLKVLCDDPLCNVGAHTVNHKNLRMTKDSFEEMIESKIQLEEILGKRVDFFAYPYGRLYNVSLKNMKEAKKAGFKYAFGTIDSPLTDINIRFNYYLPRQVLN
jgi:peptidoglycan/xylan/chitin deacetylase (PgdA/CDA1 family)